ncbi:ABC transporter ATP-binding protein [Dactylococcopsis salina]|uniref:ABC-type multidrug transport system, ATPase component n=1 Tax=Dactylococcopsis salina (strain PCC 8305) TaxID=13035 RepID=K9YSJ1_DACS8|nr:ABC transporter ATP-binding protein [Dactylococcopsis salina]AFZ49849.1 ABC-type multidrug transport system, ATPase component [Dactylococcopsis salina PCC 8305]
MLKIEGLSKRYQSREVLKNLSLTAYPQEVYGLLGPNGAGKTTTINILCNLLERDSGTIEFNQQPISEETKPLIGIAPQENLLYKSLSCEENLNFYAQLYGLSRKQRKERIDWCLNAVKLLDRSKSIVADLSGGMQRRLNIAVALVHEPQLVILDEPTTGLDIETRYEIWGLIQELQREGMTILLTTHLLDEAEKLCQRIGIIKAGKMIAEGTLDSLRQVITAQEIILIQTLETEKAIQRGREQGYVSRYYGKQLAFWLPETKDLKTIIDEFTGISIESITRQPVNLEHIYLEIMQSQP